MTKTSFFGDQVQKLNNLSKNNSEPAWVLKRNDKKYPSLKIIKTDNSIDSEF
jgi:hypothetical protein